MAAAPATAVKWHWLDSDTWKPYASDVGAKLETAYARGVKEIKVDGQRFVQILSVAELKKNFLKMPADQDKCVGMQRRYDDESKRRLVKREVPQFFADDTFHFVGNWDSSFKDELSEDITLYGGLVSGALTQKVTIVLCQRADAAGYERSREKIAQLKVHVVAEDFVYECIRQSRRVAPDAFIVKAPAPVPGEVAAAPAAPAAEKPKRGKKKDESSSDESSSEEESKKKRKKKGKKRARSDSSDDSSSSSEEDRRRKKKKKKAAPAIAFAPGSQLIGTCTSDAVYPMIVIVERVEPDAGVVAAAAPGAQPPCKLEGRIKWPTINDAETRFRGKCSAAGEVELDEYEVLRGADDVEVPNKYVGNVTGTTLAGKVEGREDKFKLDHVPPPAPPPPPPPPPLPKEFEAVKAGAELRVTLVLRHEVVISVEKAPAGVEGEVTGTATWPGGSKSHVRGTVAPDGSFVLEEIDALDKPCLRMLRGKLEGAVVKGAVAVKDVDPAVGALGAFELQLAQPAPAQAPAPAPAPAAAPAAAPAP